MKTQHARMLWLTAIVCPFACQGWMANAATTDPQTPTKTAQTEPPSSIRFDNILYGVAYYHEYMPYERLDKDLR